MIVPLSVVMIVLAVEVVWPVPPSPATMDDPCVMTMFPLVEMIVRFPPPLPDEPLPATTDPETLTSPSAVIVML